MDDTDNQNYVVSCHDCIEFDESNSHINAICFSTNNKFLASAGSDTIVRIYSLKNMKIFKILNGNIGKIFSIKFSPNSKFIASGGVDRILRVFDIQNENFEEYKGNNTAIL